MINDGFQISDWSFYLEQQQNSPLSDLRLKIQHFDLFDNG